MKKVVYFDVEYSNPVNKSICQMGIMSEDFETGEPLYPEKDIYVNPEDSFDINCINVHGITLSKVKDEPNFKTIWNEIEKYFTNAIVIGHNVQSSDLNALIKSLKRYNIDIPEIYYICTYKVAKHCISPCLIDNYSLGSLCKFFNIDIDNEHNAFDDACACADLLKILIKNYNLTFDDLIEKYNEEDIGNFVNYITSPEIRKTINEFYGYIKGIDLDKEINNIEKKKLMEWADTYRKYTNSDILNNISLQVDKILNDGIVTSAEISELENNIKTYIDDVETSPITYSTQLLNGQLKGLVCDEKINEKELKNLTKWLYENNELKGHFPYDKVLETIEKITQDGIITKSELDDLVIKINSILNPVVDLGKLVIEIKDKHICLTGDFNFGDRKKVSDYLTEKGGIIDNSIKKSTNYLIVGSLGSSAYSFGNYGGKIQKALEFNQRGATIEIIKEKQIIV